jgi:hypothetical protein
LTQRGAVRDRDAGRQPVADRPQRPARRAPLVGQPQRVGEVRGGVRRAVVGRGEQPERRARRAPDRPQVLEHRVRVGVRRSSS